MDEIFFQFLRIAIGKESCFDHSLSQAEWRMLFALCQKHALVGMGYQAIERLPQSLHPDRTCILKWFGYANLLKSHNELHSKRCKELTDIFKEGGFRSCIIKGLGLSILYPEKAYRECGDIDIWVDEDRDKIIDFVQKRGVAISSIDVQHSDMHFFDDVQVEVHFSPSYSFNPLYAYRYHRWIERVKEQQFNHFNVNLGFAYPHTDFNLVFCLMHIYRHQFSEGIGLRQLLDYYYILVHSTESERKEAYQVACSFGMKQFAAAVMYVLQRIFHLETNMMLCAAHAKYGSFLLEEIMIAGNFGHYDPRIVHVDKLKKFKRGMVQLKRNWRFVRYYPQEVLWSTGWKLWHWGWRKAKGYL